MDTNMLFAKYNKIGLKYNPFLPEPLSERDVDKLMVGRKKEIDECYRAISDRGNILIYGLKGVGKTTLLNFLKNKAKKEGLLVSSFTMPDSIRKFLLSLLSSMLKENPEPDNLDATLYYKILKDVEQYSNIPSILPTITLEKYINKYLNMFTINYPVVVLIDEMHSIINRPNIVYISYLCNYLFREDFIFVASGLTTFYKSDGATIGALRDRFSDEIPLKPLDEDEIKQIILKRIEMAWIEENSFVLPEDILQIIGEYSYGNPRNAILLSRDVIKWIADGKKVDKNEIKTILGEHSLLYSQKIMRSLSNKTKEIYLSIVNNKPATPTSLSNITGYSPQLIQYHIGILYSYGLLKRIGSGKRGKYVPNDAV